MHQMFNLYRDVFNLLTPKYNEKYFFRKNLKNVILTNISKILCTRRRLKYTLQRRKNLLN